MSVEMRAFLELVYSFAKQYIAWYDRSIKGKIPAGEKENGQY